MMKQAFEKAMEKKQAQDALKKAAVKAAELEASREARAIETHEAFLASRDGERWIAKKAKAAKVAAKAVKTAERDLKKALAKLAIILTDEVMPVVEAVEMKKTRKSAEKRAKVAGRMAYLPVPLVLATKKRVTKEMFRQFVSYETKLKPAGILEMWARAEGITDEPLFVPLEQAKTGDAETRWDDSDMRKAGSFYRSLGWRLLKGKTLIDWNATGEWFQTMLPLAVDFTAYAQRMAVPVVNGGYFHNMKVTIADLKDSNVRSAKDGCGVYDPASTNPQIRALVEKFGAVPWQITGICPRAGLFTKGLLVPEAGASKKYNADDNTVSSGIVFDVLQVKGARKAEFKDKVGTGSSETATLSVGIMTIKSAPRTIALGFEQLECVSIEKKCLMVPCAGNAPALGSTVATVRKTKGKSARVIATTDKFFAVDTDDDGLIAVIWNGGSSKEFSMQSKAKMLAASLIIDNFNEIKNDDMRLLSSMADRDEVVSGMLSLWGTVTGLPAIGKIPFIAKELAEAKKRAAYRLTTGCGVRGDQLVVVMDNTVEAGTVVTRGYKVGEEVAVWRTPNIMACGLLTLVVAEPKAHHLIDGKLARNVIRINPADCLKFQADDDGDFVGVSNDIRVVELFKCREDSNFYVVEPEGMPLLDSSGNPMATDSNEGWAYSHVDPRGPVGPMTLARTRLLAHGFLSEAKAMTWLIQEAIDIAKRYTKFTNFMYASNRGNHTVSDGVVTLKDSSVRYLDDCDANDIVAVVSKFVKRLIEDRRINDKATRKAVAARKYAWYSSDKKLNPADLPENMGESILAYAASVTSQLVKRTNWMASDSQSFDYTEMLEAVSAATGISMPELNEEAVKAASIRFGFHSYKSEVGAALKLKGERAITALNEAKSAMLDAIIPASFADAVALFADSEENTYFAFAVMLSPNSEVSQKLSVKMRSCDYLDTQVKGKKAIAVFEQWIDGVNDPASAVVNFIERSSGHEDAGYGPLVECACCRKRLEDVAVRVVRAKALVDQSFSERLITAFNKKAAVRAKEAVNAQLLQESLESGAWSFVD